MPDLPALEDLPSEPVAGLTAMARAHRNGLRRVVGRAKAWFKPGVQAETAVRTVLLTYLKEWQEVYNEGTQALGLTNTERITLVIRRDTVEQMLKELGRP